MNLDKLLNNKIINNFVKDGSFIDFKEYLNNITKNNKNPDGKLLYLFNKLRTELKLSPVGILKDDEDFLNKVEERVMTFVKGSSSVSVKDECKLGGGKICNQGDINALKITKIKE